MSVLLIILLCGCNDPAEDGPPGLSQPSPERSPQITDITDDPFSDASYVGRTVTVTGTVSRVIMPTAFVLTGEEYDDDSILVMSAHSMPVTQWQQVTVTGTVQRFGYTGDDDHDLDKDAPFADFTGEEFLIAHGTPTPVTSPAGSLNPSSRRGR